MKEMLRNPPSLIRMNNGSAKYESRPLTAARRPTRRVLPLLLLAFVLSYFAYTHFSGNATLPSILDKSSASFSTIKDGRSGRELPPAEVELEPRPHKLELVSPMYNIKVLRSILQHSNTSWQDKPNESHGYFVQSLVWFQNVSSSRRMRIHRLPHANSYFFRLTVYDPISLQTLFRQHASFPILHR